MWKIEPVVGEWEADAIGHSHDHFVRHLPVVQAQPLRLVPLGLGPWHALLGVPEGARPHVRDTASLGPKRLAKMPGKS